MNKPLTKVAVARRQLATAIDLFFADRDSVSVYSLAANAWEVIDALCRKAELQSFSVQVRENVPKGEDLKRNYINSPHRNFFKHADNDSEQTLASLLDSQVEGVLFLAVEDYIRLNQRSPIQLQVFQVWYLAKYPGKLDPIVACRIVEGIDRTFPGLALLSRREQLALGARMLLQAAGDEGLCGDPRTESAFE
ncbi:MAG: hypothetical protein Q7T13_11995 [Polaromonas sp.]|nr:hypothetical protein [Polaromonas sp.]